MLWHVLLLEKDKLFNRYMFWIELAILTLIIVIVDLGLYLISLGLSHQATTALSKTFTWPFGLISGVGLAGSHAIGGLLLIILVGTVTAQEYSWRTIHMWLCHGVSRPTLIGAKFVAALLPIVIVLLTSFVIGAVLTGCFTYALHSNLSVSYSDAKQVAIFFLVTGYSLLPYIALTFLLVVLTRSVGATIGISLAFVFLVENILYSVLLSLGGTASLVVQYLPVGLTNALLFYSNGPSPFPMAAHSVAIIGIALYTLVFTGLTFLLFQRQSFSN